MNETPTPSLLQDWLREKAHVPYFAAYRGDLLSIAHALDSLHSALTSERAAKDEKERAICRLLTIESELRTLLQDERAARERAEAELKENEAVINVWRGRTQRAEAERDALRTDAERYRWLRYGDNDEPCLHFSNNCSAGTDTVWLLRNEQLDAAIDAARKERP